MAGLISCSRKQEPKKISLEEDIALEAEEVLPEKNPIRIAIGSMITPREGYAYYKQLLDYIGEKSGSPKIGLYTPGTHIPVVDEKEIVKNQPDYVLVLSWHIGDELMGIMRKLGYKGKFIIPLPKPKIVQ